MAPPSASVAPKSRSRSVAGSAQESEEPATLRLMLLPPELRSSIYNHLFDSTPIKPLHLNLPSLWRKDFGPPIAQVPEIRQEVLREYYKRVTCKICKRPNGRDAMLEDNLDLIGSSLCYIRHFELHYGLNVRVEVFLFSDSSSPEYNEGACIARGIRHLVCAQPVPTHKHLVNYIGRTISRMLDQTLKGRLDNLNVNDLLMLLEELDEAKSRFSSILKIL